MKLSITLCIQLQLIQKLVHNVYAGTLQRGKVYQIRSIASWGKQIKAVQAVNKNARIQLFKPFRPSTDPYLLYWASFTTGCIIQFFQKPYYLNTLWSPLNHLADTRTQLFLTRPRKIKLFEPSEGIFRDPTKYWTTKKICKIGPLGPTKKPDSTIY